MDANIAVAIPNFPLSHFQFHHCIQNQQLRCYFGGHSYVGFSYKKLRHGVISQNSRYYHKYNLEYYLRFVIHTIPTQKWQHPELYPHYLERYFVCPVRTIDIKSDYQFYTFICFLSMHTYRSHVQISKFLILYVCIQTQTDKHSLFLHTWNV